MHSPSCFCCCKPIPPHRRTHACRSVLNGLTCLTYRSTGWGPHASRIDLGSSHNLSVSKCHVGGIWRKFGSFALFQTRSAAYLSAYILCIQPSFGALVISVHLLLPYPNPDFRRERRPAVDRAPDVILEVIFFIEVNSTSIFSSSSIVNKPALPPSTFEYYGTTATADACVAALARSCWSVVATM